jgi:hypothetical protein
MTAVAELRFLDMIAERSLPEWTGRSIEKLPPTPLGRQREFAAFVCSRSAAIATRSPVTLKCPLG